MEGHSYLKNPALRLLSCYKSECIVLPALLIDISSHIMKQISVKILHSAVFQLLVKNTLQILRILKISQRQLRHQLEAIPGIPFRQSPAHGLLSMVPVVCISGIKKRESNSGTMLHTLSLRLILMLSANSQQSNGKLIGFIHSIPAAAPESPLLRSQSC